MVEIKLDSTVDQIEGFLSEGGKKQLLDIIGAEVVLSTHENFDKQSLGDIEWPARYAGQGEPKINIAGVLKDFVSTSNPPAKRFQDRPALIDNKTPGLFSSIAHRVNGSESVEIGTSLPYAPVHQFGLKPKPIFITESMRENAEDFLTLRPEFDDHLSFMFVENSYAPEKLIKRPFLGLTDDLRKEILNITKQFIGDA